jgi:murein DD-endopeptidase MepM/ murein hydrolase activator NlpD
LPQSVITSKGAAEACPASEGLVCLIDRTPLAAAFVPASQSPPRGRKRRLCAALLSAAALAFLFSARGGEPVHAAQPLHLPYPGGVVVDIIQGYNGGTHTGVERYSLDLVRSDGKTSGSPVLAPASGTVAFAQLPGQEHGCIGVGMEDSGDLHYMLCHTILGRVYSYGDRIQIGQQLGTVGAPGLVGNNGSAHVHMQLYTLAGGQRTPVPFAAPPGLPLESSPMATDGTYNQWACAGAGCHNLVSRMPPSSTTLFSADIGQGSAELAGPVSSTTTLAVGAAAIVQGTNDCLRVHVQAGVTAVSVGCAPDGTVVYVSDGPKQADGYTWCFLRTLGWSVADYLRPSGVSGSVSISKSGDGAPDSAAASSSMVVGATVVVANTGACLRLHRDPALEAPMLSCLTDGTRAVLRDGPQQSDGHTWWRLDSGGWAVADYLQAAP